MQKNVQTEQFVKERKEGKSKVADQVCLREAVMVKKLECEKKKWRSRASQALRANGAVQAPGAQARKRGTECVRCCLHGLL